jgi:hypothetical protein
MELMAEGLFGRALLTGATAAKKAQADPWKLKSFSRRHTDPNRN